MLYVGTQSGDLYTCGESAGMSLEQTDGRFRSRRFRSRRSLLRLYASGFKA